MRTDRYQLEAQKVIGISVVSFGSNERLVVGVAFIKQAGRRTHDIIHLRLRGAA